MALRRLSLSKKALFNALNCSRKFSVSSCAYDKVLASKSEAVRPNWDRAVDEAVKCVGYQTPYLTLSYLTNDQDVRWMDNMEKLEGSNHPMCETAK